MKEKNSKKLEPLFKVTAKAPKYDEEEARRNYEILM
jgi:hypothetical protein